MNKADLLAERSHALELLDAYEALLTDTQRGIASEYYRFDLSLSEISENRGISRAAASEAINKSIAKLEEIEAKIGLIAERSRLRKQFEEAEKKKDPVERLSAYESIGKEYTNGI